MSPPGRCRNWRTPEIVENREVLEDRLDAGPAGVAGRIEVELFAGKTDLALVELHDATDRAHQRGLARAIVAEQRQDLALAQVRSTPSSAVTKP